MSETLDVECRIVREGDNAILIDYEGEELWIPLSQIEKITRQAKGPSIVRMKRWIAEKKGIV